MNADQAKQAYDIAQRHYNSDNLDSAIRFAKKSISLHSTPEAVSLLSKLEKAASNPSSSSSKPSATSSATKGPNDGPSRPTPRASTSSSSTPAPEQKKRDFTPAQAALVKRVRACRVTEYYEILEIKKGCSDGEVKKAYRKVRPFLSRASAGSRACLLTICVLGFIVGVGCVEEIE